MKRKPVRSRRRCALRWTAALCMLMLACHWLGLYGLTPRRALQKQERYLFTGGLMLVDSVRDDYERGFGVGRILAAENDGFFLLGLARWTPWKGWQPGFAWTVERTDSAVDALNAYYSWGFEHARYPHTLFGYVNDARAAGVQFRAENGLWQNAVLRTDRAGRRYFLETYVSETPEAELMLLDAQGNDLVGSVTPEIISLDYDWDI